MIAIPRSARNAKLAAPDDNVAPEKTVYNAHSGNGAHSRRAVAVVQGTIHRIIGHDTPPPGETRMA